jgi:hypothetical protein
LIIPRVGGDVLVLVSPANQEPDQEKERREERDRGDDDACKGSMAETMIVYNQHKPYDQEYLTYPLSLRPASRLDPLNAAPFVDPGRADKVEELEVWVTSLASIVATASNVFDVDVDVDVVFEPGVNDELAVALIVTAAKGVSVTVGSTSSPSLGTV